MNEEEKTTRKRAVIRGNVLMLGLVSFFTDASSEMAYPLLPVFLTGILPVTAAAVYLGLMEGVAESVSSLLKIYSGRLSDRLSVRKNIAVIGYGVSTVFRPLFCAASAGWQVVGIRLGDRVGKGLRTSPRDALISDSVDCDSRGLAFSFHRVMDHAGAVTGSVIAVLILYAFLGRGLWSGSEITAGPDEIRALRWLFAIAIVPGLAAMITLVGRVKEVVPACPDPQAKTRDAPSEWKLLPRRFYLFVAIVTLFTLGNSSDLFLLFYGKTRFGLSLLHFIGLWVALHVSKIIFSLPGGALSDRLGRRIMVASGWLIYFVVYLGMAGVRSLPMFYALIFIYGAYYGLTEGAEKALIADYVESEHRGKAYGLYHGAIGMATLPASLLFGVFWASLGPRLAFTIGACLAGAATVLLVLLLGSGKKSVRSRAAATFEDDG